MFWLELLVVLAALALGARLGGIFLGIAGGLGLAFLVFVFGLAPSAPPIDVMLIITAVIVAASVLQVAGGMDYLVSVAEKILCTSVVWLPASSRRASLVKRLPLCRRRVPSFPSRSSCSVLF